nr:MAG TPA: hypothetical protein [Caudoviricetes sp.]
MLEYLTIIIPNLAITIVICSWFAAETIKCFLAK